MATSIVPVMTSNSAPSPYNATCGSNSLGCDAYKAFDGDDNTYWGKDSNTSNYLQIYLGSAKTVASYSITSISNFSASMPKKWTFEGSNNGSSWTILDTRTNETNWGSEIRKYVISNPSAFTYYKINITANNGHGWLAILTMQLYEPEPPNTPTDFTKNINGYNATLSWTAVNNVTGYKLYKNNVLFDTITETTYTLTSITEQNDEYYITAYNDVGESAPSDTITVTTIPNAPTNLTITQVPTGFKLDWTDNSSIETNYKIQKRISGGEWADLVTLAANITTYTDEFTNEDGTLYEYQVCATNTQGFSAYTTWGITTVDSVTLSANLQDSLDKITYNWTENSTATGYKLHIGEQIIDVAGLSYDYAYTGELNVNAYVVAYITNDYDTFYSSDSNVVNSISSPKTTVSNINYIISGSDITFTWDDNSTVESGFKLSYKIDSGAETIVDIPSTSSSTTGTQYSKTITVSNVLSNVLVKLAHYNSTGIGQYSSDITIITAPKIFQGKYDDVNNLAKLGWINNNADSIILKYSIDGGTEQTYTSNSAGNVLYDIPLASTSTLTATLIPIYNELEGFPSEILTIGDGLNVDLEVPSQFDVGWDSDGIAEYIWTDNSNREIGYKFVYLINGGTEQEVDVTSTSTLTAGNVYSAQITLTNHLDTVVGKVKAYSLVDESEFTNTVEQIYYLVDPIVPPNFIKIRTETGVHLQWDAVSYIDHYEITYILNETEYKIETANTYANIDIDYNTVTSFSAYLTAYYSGGKISDASEIISYSPTISFNYVAYDVYNDTISSFDVLNIFYNETTLEKDIEIKTYEQNLEFVNINIATLNLDYNIENEGIIDTSTYYVDIVSFMNELLIKNNNTTFSNDIETKTYWEDVESYGIISTNSFRRALPQINGSIVQSIKNQRLINGIFDVCQNIYVQDLLQSSYPVITLSYVRAEFLTEPLHYIIYTHTDLSMPIETEIHKIRLCTMGDSITAGHPGYWAESGTGDPQSQYQYWLQKRLGTDFEVQNNGYGSDTTLRCLNRFNRDVVQKHPQYVIIQAGTNDIHWALAEAKDDQAYLDAKMEQAKTNTIAMVDISLANNITPIIGTLIPRTSAKGIYRQALWDFNDWIINYCNSREDVFYVDFYNAGKQNIPPTPLEEPNVPGNMNPLYDGDSRFDEYGNLIRRGQGVHPSVVGYKLMAEAVPLSLFKSLISDVKIYLDEACLTEENNIVYADTTKEYNMTFKNLNRGRSRVTNRYIKNLSNNPVLYSLYATKEAGLDIKFSIDGVEYKDVINGLISSGGIIKLYIQLDVPKFGEVPEIALNLATRMMKN